MSTLLSQEIIGCIFKYFIKNNPKPNTELIYNSTFQLLISVILSAQATDASVNKATRVLFSVAPTPKDLVNLGVSNIETYLRHLNFYRNKSRYIYETARVIQTQYNNQVPQERKELEKLLGVGRKTANVVLNTAFQKPCIAVDTHVFRVSARLGITRAKTPEECEKQLMKRIPKAYLHQAHHWLVLHGRYICKAKKPACDSCALHGWCNSAFLHHK